MKSVGAFSVTQPIYAALGIATFPVEIQDGRKVPAIRGWQQISLRGSATLANTFTHAEMLGFCLGDQSGVTVLDVDTQDERVFADALSRHGNTPLIIRTASGKFHGYYKYDGERRLVRPFPGEPIDLLGGGFVVAPPSVAPSRRRYEIIEGRLEDILTLPVIRGVDDLRKAREIVVSRTREGERNNVLWRSCMRMAKLCTDFDELLLLARREAANYDPPVEDDEVIKAAQSAWSYETRGENRFGGPAKLDMTLDEVDALVTSDPDAYLMLTVLRRYHSGRPDFILANAMAKRFRWGINRFKSARDRLEALGKIECLHRGGRGKADPPIFTFHA